jgi:uncharacterized membrane protein YccC
MIRALNGSQWRYCAKVGIAAALGYALSQGNYNHYAIYAAFTAALIVGTSVGEDLATSGNRVKGTLAGLIAGTLATALVGPNFLAVGAAASLTALVALGFGWGVPVARIGVTVCIVTLAVHSANAVHYEFYRALNTLIGIVAGLAVTYFVWPVRGRTELGRTAREVLSACRTLLDAMASGEQNLRPLQGRLHDAIAALVKAGRDARREWKTGDPPDVDPEGIIEVIRLGTDVLAAALGPPSADSLQALNLRLERLSGPVSSRQ